MKINNNDIREAYMNLAALRKSKKKHINGIEIYTILLLIMQAGIKNKEIWTLLRSDLVYTKNRIIGLNLKIATNSSVFKKFPPYLSREMKRYISHQFPNIKINQLDNTPLFPTYYGSNSRKKLERHLDKFDYKIGSFLHNWDMNFLKKIGITEYYDQLKKNNINKQACIQQTALQYRKSDAQVKNILNGVVDKKQSTFEKFMEHQDQGTIKIFYGQNEIDAFIEEGINLIKKIKMPKTEKKKIEDDFLENAKRLSIKAKKTSHVNTHFNKLPTPKLNSFSNIKSDQAIDIDLEKRLKLWSKNRSDTSNNSNYPRRSNNKIRVYELAQELSITNEQLLWVLKELKIKVESDGSLLTKTNVETIKNNPLLIKEAKEKTSRNPWRNPIRSKPKNKDYDISKFHNESADLTKDMDSCKLQQKNELLASYILRRHEFFKKVEKRTDFMGIPCDFVGFKKNIPYIIKFKCFSNSFNPPNKTQREELHKSLTENKMFEMVLLQIKIKKKKSEYRIFYTKDMEIFSPGFKVPSPIRRRSTNPILRS